MCVILIFKKMIAFAAFIMVICGCICLFTGEKILPLTMFC